MSADEAARRLKEDGANVLPEAKVDGLRIVFLRQLQSPCMYLLLIAGAVVFLFGEIADGVIIFIVLLFNAIVGTIQEGGAQEVSLTVI